MTDRRKAQIIRVAIVAVCIFAGTHLGPAHGATPPPDGGTPWKNTTVAAHAKVWIVKFSGVTVGKSQAHCVTQKGMYYACNIEYTDAGFTEETLDFTLRNCYRRTVPAGRARDRYWDVQGRAWLRMSKTEILVCDVNPIDSLPVFAASRALVVGCSHDA